MMKLCFWSLLLGCSVTVVCALSVRVVHAQSSGGNNTCPIAAFPGCKNPTCPAGTPNCVAGKSACFCK
jgi:hypothetical protein